MNYEKFSKYNLRDDFLFPVYVGFDLEELQGIKGIDPENRFAGQLTRSNRETYLDLSVIPKKQNTVANGIAYDEEDKILSQDDSRDWYASTWDGSLLFVLHKYYRTQINTRSSHNSFSGEISRWLITDFSIATQFMLSDKVGQVKLYMDHVFSWFNIVNPGQELSEIEPVVYKGLLYKKVNFSLSLSGESSEKSKLHSYEKNVELSIKIKFDKPQSRDFVYSLSVELRNMLQVLINKPIGIWKIVLNKNESLKNGKLSPLDKRENWFLEQSYLPNKVEEKRSNWEYPFSSVKDNFDTILVSYLSNNKLQSLVYAYLSVDQFKIPVSTAIVVLISGIETYYNEAEYENGKQISKAEKKLERFLSLLDSPENIISNSFDGQNLDLDGLLKKLKYSRDYFVHGLKKEKFTSEADLVPSLLIFKQLYHKILAELITLKVQENN